MKKYLLGILFSTIAIAGYYGSSSGSGGTWGSITGTLSNQTDLNSSLNGKVATTGNEPVAGIKTFSSAPILSGLTAQAIPYLNSAQTLANGGWTQADTTFATTLTPASTISGSALLIDLSGMTGTDYGIRIASGVKATTAPLRIEGAYTGTTAVKQSSTLATGTSSSGYVFNHWSENAVACTGDVMGWNAGSAAWCGGGTFISDSGAGSPGTQVGVYGAGTNAVHTVGGGFQATNAKSGAGNKAVGVHATASGENSAQTIGVFTKILSANSSANLENFYPTISGALIADNGDIAANVITGMDNGSSVFQVQDGGTVVMGANGGTPVHELNTATSSTGAVSLTMTNGPTGTTAAAALYIRIKINNLFYVIPAWRSP